jgi:lysine 2,3-aminomutase
MPARLPPTACGRRSSDLLCRIAGLPSATTARRRLFDYCARRQYATATARAGEDPYYVVRDCARALRGMFTDRAERLAGFSTAAALWDVARGVPRPDLSPAFFADVSHALEGLQGRGQVCHRLIESAHEELSGRAAALARSDELDRLSRDAASWMDRYADGLSDDARTRRTARRARVRTALGGAEGDWEDWRWQFANVLTEPGKLAAAVHLRSDESAAVREAVAARLPFGITPYYASLLDDDPEVGRDRALRAQVLPPPEYVREMRAHEGERGCHFDFMRESDTSPVDLVTRRYPGIVILKPFNTCPQICVYCQRNWEIEQPMAPDALAPWPAIEKACAWIEAHPAINEVLVTGGDPMALDDAALLRVLERVAAIPQVDLIRIGTRVPVTAPMRITEALADRLATLRVPGRRDLAVMTHVEHPYEITPDLVAAVDRLRRRGIAVYNQLVYTFFVSRRFEAARLRTLLRRIGVDPYYTFMPKGKEETAAYRVPLARLLQEQKEEARLLPGLRRTDAAVINLPGLGKNNVRAIQHRDLIGVGPDGGRRYEFHPWEKNVAQCESYVGTDVPILEYLQRLAAAGENPADYDGIWYYF